LRSTGQINDGQPSVTETKMRLRVEAFAIRATPMACRRPR